MKYPVVPSRRERGEQFDDRRPVWLPPAKIRNFQWGFNLIGVLQVMRLIPQYENPVSDGESEDQIIAIVVCPSPSPALRARRYGKADCVLINSWKLGRRYY